LLSQLLVPALKAASPVGNEQIPSGGTPFQAHILDDLEGAKVPECIPSYSHSQHVKRVVSLALEKELAAHGIAANVVGWHSPGATSMTASVNIGDLLDVHGGARRREVRMPPPPPPPCPFISREDGKVRGAGRGKSDDGLKGHLARKDAHPRRTLVGIPMALRWSLGGSGGGLGGGGGFLCARCPCSWAPRV
jgi:hypothetical protein